MDLDALDGSVGQESACNMGVTGDTGLIPGLGRSPGGGNGNPLQYSRLKKSHGQRSLAGYSPKGLKESDTTEQLTTQDGFNRTGPGNGAAFPAGILVTCLWLLSLYVPMSLCPCVSVSLGPPGSSSSLLHVWLRRSTHSTVKTCEVLGRTRKWSRLCCAYYYRC